MSNQPIYTIDKKHYIDPHLYEEEKKKVMMRTWQFAGHASQLQNTGDYFTFEIAGQPLFCIKDDKQEIRCFYNVCKHRAHELLKGSGNSKRAANLIICPYHGWAYHYDGTFKAAPNIKVVPNLDISKLCLTEVRLENFLGFLFVNLDKSTAPMDEWFPEVRKELEDFVPFIYQLKPLKWVEIPESCNWKVSVENYSECYHCSINHKTFSTGVVKPSTYRILPQGYCLRHTTECQNLEKMTYPIDLNSNPNAGNYSSWFLWPLFSFQVYPGNVLNTYHWRIIDVDHIVLWRGWYSVDGQPSEVVEKLALQDRETTVEEDIGLVESVQKGLKSNGYDQGILVVDPTCGVNSEHSIQKLQQWYSEYTQ